MAAVAREAEQVEEFNSKRDELIAELAAVQRETSLQGKIAWLKSCWVPPRCLSNWSPARRA